MSFFAYLITDGRYGVSSPGAFTKRFNTILDEHCVDYAVYRDVQTSDYTQYAATFVDLCQARGIKAMLHRNIDLAVALGADGVHLTSKQFEEIAAAKAEQLFTVISTHSLLEIMHAAQEGADAITYSPIFESPGKGEPKGLEDLKETTGRIDLPVIALGGIMSAEQIEAVKAAGAAGFASIRFFL